MSNLYKTGFQNLAVKQGDVYILDANKKMKAYNGDHGKVIRPIDEEKETEETGGMSAGEILISDAMDKAKSLNEDANMKAAMIISEAEERADEIREQARREGYEQGLKEGNDEAGEQARVYLENVQAEQEKKKLENSRLVKEQLETSEKEIIDLTCRLITKLTGMMVDEYKPVMLYMINESLAKSDASRKFVIHVSDEIYQYIEDNKERLVGAANPGIEIEIYGDARLKKSECQIETDNGIIDLSMDVQVKNLITAIKLLSD